MVINTTKTSGFDSITGQILEQFPEKFTQLLEQKKLFGHSRFWIPGTIKRIRKLVNIDVSQTFHKICHKLVIQTSQPPKLSGQPWQQYSLYHERILLVAQPTYFFASKRISEDLYEISGW